MHDPDRMPTEIEISSEEMIAKARKRGEDLGFSGTFLDCFIEREIRMMWKWNASKTSNFGVEAPTGIDVKT